MLTKPVFKYLKPKYFPQFNTYLHQNCHVNCPCQCGGYQTVSRDFYGVFLEISTGGNLNSRCQDFKFSAILKSKLCNFYRLKIDEWVLLTYLHALAWINITVTTMQLILKKLIFFSTTTVQASRIGQICWRLTTLKTSLAHVVLHQQGCVVAFYLAPQHSLDTIHF